MSNARKLTVDPGNGTRQNETNDGTVE